MEGKNVVYLVAIVVTCLFVVLILAYIPNFKGIFLNADSSSKLINHVENNIDDNPNNDNTQSRPVLKKINTLDESLKPSVATSHAQIRNLDIPPKPPAQKPLDLSKIKEQLNNPKDFIDDKYVVEQSLESLVAPRNESFNDIEVDSTRPFMEFSVPNNLIIGQSSFDTGNEFRYEVKYNFGWHTTDMQLLQNTTDFQDTLAERGYAAITYRYTEDKNKSTRDSMLSNSRNNNDMISYIKKNYPVKASLEQRVEFFMWDVKFNKFLRMPKKLTIWNEHSTELYPCYLIEHNFPHGGTSYNVDYTCKKLPNFNDYGGNLKFIFN